MASPQLEDGYTRISNQIIEAIGSMDLNAAEYKVLLCVFRYTYGFNRKSHTLSASFIARWGNCSIRTVKRALMRLEELKVIEILNSGCRGVTSEIALNKDFDTWDMSGDKNDTSDKNDTGVVTEMTPELVTEMSPKKRKKKEKYKEKYNVELSSTIYPFPDIIEYLNEKTGKSFRWQTKTTQRHIRARCEEGYSLEDFRRVIDSKVSEWKGSEWEKYLRPETLFGTKFESYLNSSPKRQQEQEEVRAEESIFERFCRLPEETFREFRKLGIITADGGVDCEYASMEQIRLLQESGAL